MENKINIVELLKDCPTGMELDCTMYNKVTLLNVDADDTTFFPISVVRKDGNIITLTKYGQYANVDFAKCVIFPKGKTTWEGFVPPCKSKKESEDEKIRKALISILKSDFEKDATIFDISIEQIITWLEKQESVGEIVSRCKNSWFNEGKIQGQIEGLSDEKKYQQGWHDALEKQGEQKTNDKVEPKFKAGDEIVNIYRKRLNGDSRSWKIYQIANVKYIFTDGSFIYIQDQNNWVLSTAKFDITTLKPFDKVLMRSSNAREWVATFYSHYSNNKFYGCGMCCDQCIPYEGNEHLLGTTDDCDEYFNLIS